MARKPYPSDLTDRQWQLIEPFIPPERWGGRTRSVDVREVLNGIFYLLRSGCAWPRDPARPAQLGHLPPLLRPLPRRRHLVADPRALARRHARERAGRNPDPSAAVVDAQSVKTTEKGGSTVTTRASA